MKDSKKMFLTGLLCTLLLLANVVAAKITVIAKLSLSCSIFVYPFTFLCVALITHFYGAKEGIKSVLFTVIFQIFFYGMGMLICNLPVETSSLFQSNALQTVLAPELTQKLFHPNYMVAFGSIFAFTVSQMMNIGMITLAKKYTDKTIAATFAMLLSLLLDAVIYTCISQIGITETLSITTILLNQFIARVMITILSGILFYIFTYSKKEKI